VQNEFQDHNEASELGMQDEGIRSYDDDDQSFQLMWERKRRQWQDANRRLM